MVRYFLGVMGVHPGGGGFSGVHPLDGPGKDGESQDEGEGVSLDEKEKTTILV
jgi:hypothetical protein